MADSGDVSSAGGNLRTRREAVVAEHMDSENRHEFDTTLATFGHPRYEIVPTGDVYDGPEEVMGYFAESRTAFPDQRNTLVELHHADDSIVVEFDLEGTHLGKLRGLPPTGRSFKCRTLAIFVFEPGTDRIVCERVYFDTATIFRQLGVAHDPLKLGGRLATVVNHPVTIGRALVRQVTGR